MLFEEEFRIERPKRDPNLPKSGEQKIVEEMLADLRKKVPLLTDPYADVYKYGKKDANKPE